MRFLRELRQLRADAGLASVELAARAHYPHEVIVAAEAGPTLPDLPVLSAYLRGCGAGLADWEERWRALTGSPATAHCLPSRPAGCSGLASAGARLGTAIPEVDAADQRRIMDAISRADAAIAATTIPAQPLDAASASLISATEATAPASAARATAATASTSAAHAVEASPAASATGMTEVTGVACSADAVTTPADPVITPPGALTSVATVSVATASRPVPRSTRSAGSRRTAFPRLRRWWRRSRA